VIGHSVDVDLLRGNGSDASGLTLSHSLLQRLLERYPFGHVFSFDELGVVLQQHPGEVGQERTHPSRAASQDGSQCSEDSTSPSEAQDAAELLGAATDARSIAFTTLWDYRNDRWFAASISKCGDMFMSTTRVINNVCLQAGLLTHFGFSKQVN
jgi:hypothetical protein